MDGENKYRKPELEQYKPIFLTRQGHELLRKQKEKDKQRSMAKILNDLIIEKYGNEQI